MVRAMEEVLEKIATGSIVFGDHPSAPGLRSVSDETRARVAERLAFINIEGRKHEGIAEGCGPQKVPPWYDEVAFKRAQALFRDFTSL